MTGHAVSLSTICSSGRLNFIKAEEEEKANKKGVVGACSCSGHSCVFMCVFCW